MLTLKLKRHGNSYSLDTNGRFVAALCEDVVAAVLECGRNECPNMVEVIVSKTLADVDGIRGNGFRLKPYLPANGMCREGLPWCEFVEVGWKNGELLYPSVQTIEEIESIMVILDDGTFETRDVICLHGGALDILLPIANESMDDIFILIRRL